MDVSILTGIAILSESSWDQHIDTCTKVVEFLSFMPPSLSARKWTNNIKTHRKALALAYGKSGTGAIHSLFLLNISLLILREEKENFVTK